MACKWPQDANKNESIKNYHQTLQIQLEWQTDEKGSNMARTKKDAEREVWFKEPNKETKPFTSMKNVPPQCQAEKIIMSSDENRHYMAGVLQRVSGFMRMKKVNSNKELMERIDDYFRYCIDEEVPPTDRKSVV